MSRFASICVLSFNRPAFVTEAITSAVREAQMPVEVLVHDDGSDEETVSALLSLKDQGLISTLLLNQRGHNEGQGIALNRMFQMAKGDPIVKFDHDLICAPGWLAKAAGILRFNENNAMQPQIGCLGLFKYHTEPVHHAEMHIRSHEGFDEVKDFVGSAMVIPRRAWEEFGPFEERSAAFAEDYQFKMDVASRPNWCNALLSQDVVVNQGFGLGPSTVVVETPEGGLTSRAIKTEPWMAGPR